jgi:hypothetical protein
LFQPLNLELNILVSKSSKCNLYRYTGESIQSFLLRSDGGGSGGGGGGDSDDDLFDPLASVDSQDISFTDISASAADGEWSGATSADSLDRSAKVGALQVESS